MELIKRTLTRQLEYLEWETVAKAVEQKLGIADIRNYKGVDFWHVWYFEVDDSIESGEVSENTVNVKEYLNNFRAELVQISQDFGDEEFDGPDETEQAIIELLEATIEVMGPLADQDIHFYYYW